MPSPFPGMDPFLEHPDFFPDLHGSINVYLREALQGSLPEPYYAVINERLWVESNERYVEPDVDILRAAGPGRGGTALATRSRTTPLVITVPQVEFRETYVEIRTRRDPSGERIVTSIEVLSPSNKEKGGRGRDEYRKKQREVLDSDVHLVEIDLLRSGEHSTAVPVGRLRSKAGEYDYHVSIHRFDVAEEFHVYPFQIEDPMPEIAVPLLPGDGDVRVDLQAVFQRAYDSGPYKRRVPYNPRDLTPKLPAKRLAWVRQRLKNKH